jgi:hypothetical protein
MTMVRPFLISSAFALALTTAAQAEPPHAAAAGAQEPAQRDCFNASLVSGFNLIDNHTVDVSVGANRHYWLTTAWNAHDLNWSEAIALHSTTGWICAGNGLGVEISGGHPHMTYPITGIARAPEAQQRPAAGEHHDNLN